MSIFDSTLIEKIRKVGGLPNDEICRELIGKTLSAAIEDIGQTHTCRPPISEKPKAYEYKVQSRPIVELGNNLQRKVINNLLFILERRIVNHIKFPMEPDCYYISQTKTGKDKLATNTFFSDYRIQGALGYAIHTTCVNLMKELEKADWQFTQRKTQPLSKCPQPRGIQHQCLSTAQLNSLIGKQIALDSELLTQLRSLSRKKYLNNIETSEAITQLKPLIKAMKSWQKSRKLKDRKQLSSTYITEGHRAISTKGLRRISLVKSCQTLFELTVRAEIKFRRDRTKANRPRISQFGSMCCLIAKHLGEKRFTISTCESILKENKSRAWLLTEMYESLTEQSGTTNLSKAEILSTFRENLAAKGMYIPPSDELSTEMDKLEVMLSRLRQTKKRK